MGTGAVAALLLAGAAASMGFSTPAAYPRPIAEGGGGGRFFTGSHHDAIGCASCHEPAGSFALELDGLPDRYTPGTTLTVVAQWPEVDRTVSLVAEWVNEDGDPVGEVRLAPDALVEDADRCASGSVAASIYATDDEERRIIGMPACGATRMRMQWTGPEDLEGPVSLHIGAVASDDADDPEGDWVAQTASVLPNVDDASEQGCRSGPGGSALTALCLLLPWVRRRRRRRSCAPKHLP